MFRKIVVPYSSGTSSQDKYTAWPCRVLQKSIPNHSPVLSWIWRHYEAPKRREIPVKRHGFTSQKAWMLTKISFSQNTTIYSIM
jgi:hypothetical protein